MYFITTTKATTAKTPGDEQNPLLEQGNGDAGGMYPKKVQPATFFVGQVLVDFQTCVNQRNYLKNPEIYYRQLLGFFFFYKY